MNTLSATIAEIAASDHLSCLSATVGEDTFHLLLAEPFDEPTGFPVILAFKETEVILTKEPSPSTANRAMAMIRKIRRGEVLTEVTLEYGQTSLAALVPTLTFDPLGLEEGMSVGWMVQPGEISLMRGNHGN